MACLKKRGDVYYAQIYIGGKQRRVSLKTKSLQIAKEKLRRIESAKAQGNDNPLPSRTPIGQVVAAYVDHIRTVKTPKSAQTDIYYAPTPGQASAGCLGPRTPGRYRP